MANTDAKLNNHQTISALAKEVEDAEALLKQRKNAETDARGMATTALNRYEEAVKKFKEASALFTKDPARI